MAIFDKPPFLGSADFLGLNYYASNKVFDKTTFAYGDDQLEYDGAFRAEGLYPYPDGLRKLLVYASKEYGVPVLVTENGYGDGTGTLNDTERLNYVKTHIIATLKGRTLQET